MSWETYLAKLSYFKRLQNKRQNANDSKTRRNLAREIQKLNLELARMEHGFGLRPALVPAKKQVRERPRI